MSNFFVCYAREDSEFAVKLVNHLRERGVSLWFDQHDISPGDRWDSAVGKALLESPSLLIILSPHSIASENVMDEFAQAKKLGKRIVPVLHRACNIPFQIARLQYIDFTSSYERGLEQLVAVVESRAQPPVQAGPTTNRTWADFVDRRHLKRILVPAAAVVGLTGVVWGHMYLKGASDIEVTIDATADRPGWCQGDNLRADERTICDTKSLWPLEAELNRRYDAAQHLVRKDADKFDALVSTEGVWLTRVRAPCESDVSCLDRRYRSRIKALANFR
jgi:TIR domain